MSWVDLVIVIFVILAALRGFAAGAITQIAMFIGLGAGFYVGTLIAPSLAGDITKGHWRPGLALIIVLVAVMLGAVVGGMLGRLVSRVVSVLMLGMVDRIAGVAVSAAAALVFCWLVAGLLASAPAASIDSAIQNSAILSALDHVMPPVPSVESQVQSLFRRAGVPSIFADVIAPTLPQPVQPSTLAPPVNHLSEPSNVVKVLASGGCSEESEGTAFYVTRSEVVTNAHVVAGHTKVTVGGAPAAVALYDPDNDIAVLRVSKGGTPLSFLSAEPSSDAPIQIVGFPLNESRTRSDGYYEGEITADGRNFYNQDLAARTILSLEANIEPGNSGSPVLVGGKVAGVVESYSLSQLSTAYAIPLSVVEQDIANTPGTGSVSTQGCLND
ncbi:MAG: CvpA family protein [Acidimicrobiales bacterium]